MNIRHLHELLSRIEEITVIGKNAEVDGVICHVMGIVRCGTQMRLLILIYDEAFQQRIEEAEEAEAAGLCCAFQRPDTNRTVLRSDRHLEASNPFKAVSKVSIKDAEFEVCSLESRRLSSKDYECILMFSEFLRHGWQPDGIDFQDIDMLFITILDLMGEYAAIPAFGENPALRFTMRPDSTAHPVEQPVTLTVGGKYPDKLYFRDASDGKQHWVQINRVYLSDMWAEMEKVFDSPQIKEQMTPEQIAQARSDFKQRFLEICPRGMCFPIIEYECEEDISLQFYSKAYLDAAPVHRGSTMAFIVRPDQPTGILGLPLKAAIIQEPVPAETVSIEAELFQYNKTTVGYDIVLK